MLKLYIRQFAPFILFVTTLAVIFVATRLGLMLWQHERLEVGQWGLVLLGGVRIDLSSIAYIALPLLIINVVYLMAPRKLKYVLFILLKAYAALTIATIVLVEAATPAFILQYDVRPNRLFIEYVQYPKEVLSMLANGHFLAAAISLILALIFAIATIRYIPRPYCQHQSRRFSVFAVLITVVTLAVLARGTFAHRPLNPALVYFSQDALVNSLILNSSYSVVFAAKNMASERSAQTLYGAMAEEQVVKIMKSSTFRSSMGDEHIPTLTVNAPYHQGQSKNVVIILEESLGARFVGALGGKGLTPQLDNLYAQGWGFHSLYATGTRSVRGIEAVISGFLPSPSRSVVKLSKSQKQFFTIAQLLARHGYMTQFIYGGESHFDNMKSFFLGNGFQDIVDMNDIADPQFTSSWGVSDEDLFIQADKELSYLAQQQRPFFSLIFTSSNHDPFDIPENKVVLDAVGTNEHVKRDLAIRYADMALGQFIERAKHSEYWQDTVFLIVADHDVRVYGREPVPIKSFHIPGVILNSPFDGIQDDRLVSQIDLPVTLLSLAGIEAATPMTGFDLTKHYPVERALMQYYDNFAYLENDKAVVLMPGQRASYWSYNKASKTQTSLSTGNKLVTLKNKALAHALYSTMAYQKRLYRLPQPK